MAQLKDENNSGISIPAGLRVDGNIKGSLLYQNVPNPFSESTQIKYFIPKGTSNAQMMIFNMNGTTLFTYELISQGENSITIKGGELDSGMYLYSLIIEGREVDTKRMILTK